MRERIDHEGKVMLDREQNVLIVDDVMVDMAVLPALVRPNPERYYRMERKGDLITVFTYTPDDVVREVTRALLAGGAEKDEVA